MNFKNKRFITTGVDSDVSPLLQLFMWHCIDAMPPPKDYLQIFELSAENGKVRIKHIQEETGYRQEYLIDAPVLVGKIFVIDDETHSTMLLAEEY